MARAHVVAWLSVGLLLASCRVVLHSPASEAEGLTLSFRVFGYAGPSAAGDGSRLLLPSATTLTVDLVPANPAQGATISKSVVISADKAYVEATIPIRKVGAGIWKLTAVAMDASKVIRFRGEASIEVSAQMGSVPVTLLPVNPLEAGKTAKAQRLSRTDSSSSALTLANQDSLSWSIPAEASSSGACPIWVGGGADISLFAQYADGSLALDGKRGPIGLDKQAPGSLLTLYNSGTKSEDFDLVINPYHLVFDGNGATSGSAPVDTRGYVAGDSIALPGASSLARAGYAFSGWNSQANGAGTTYAVGASFTLPDGGATLYAKWISTGTIEVSLNNPNDQDLTFSNGNPTLNAAVSASVQINATGASYANYLWTVSGSDPLPVLADGTKASMTLSVSPATQIGAYTVTLLFGNGSSGTIQDYQYSKRFILQVTRE